MKRLLEVAGISLSIFLWTLPAMAQATRSIPISQARGDAEVVTLELYRGHGLTLNFRPVGETIRRAWLDDLSKVTLSFDDANCGTEEESCAASVIHLRRINPLNFPDLPATETTALTIVTDSGVYLFRLTFPEAGNPSFYTVEIQPDSMYRQPPGNETRTGNSAGADLIAQGLNVAQSRSLIEEGDDLWDRVQKLIAAVRDGMQVEAAAAETGVSPEVVAQLVRLGRLPASEISL
jgi:hypothetical protein